MITVSKEGTLFQVSSPCCAYQLWEI